MPGNSAGLSTWGCPPVLALGGDSLAEAPGGTPCVHCPSGAVKQPLSACPPSIAHVPIASLCHVRNARPLTDAFMPLRRLWAIRQQLFIGPTPGLWS